MRFQFIVLKSLVGFVTRIPFRAVIGGPVLPGSTVLVPQGVDNVLRTSSVLANRSSIDMHSQENTVVQCRRESLYQQR